MQYILLIYRNEQEAAATPPAALNSMMQEYEAFTKSIVQAGQFKAGDRLKPASTASTVRVRNGKTMITDGPFAETREQLGGYYLIEAKNLGWRQPRAFRALSTAASRCARCGPPGGEESPRQTRRSRRYLAGRRAGCWLP